MNGYEVDELGLKCEVSLLPKAPAKRQDFFSKHSESFRFSRAKTREIHSESFEAGGFCDNFVTKADQGRMTRLRPAVVELRRGKRSTRPSFGNCAATASQAYPCLVS
jgi:hypothetical protein